MDGDILDLLRKRRTIRRFTSQEVPDDKIAALIEAGFYAPTYLNRKPWNFLVVKDKKLQDSLGSILGVRPYVQEASAVIVLIGDPDISNAWQPDLTAAGENIAIAATAMGLGLAWVGNPASVAWDVTEKKIKELLGIPARMGILCLQAIGYSAKEVEPHTKQERWDDSRVHYNKFSNLKGEWAPKAK